MCIFALALELLAGIDYEIALHLFPNEMKIIVRAPDILATAANGILTAFIIVFHGAWNFGISNIHMSLENAYGLGLCKSDMAYQEEEANSQYRFHGMPIL